jgi:hypothetical protein
MKEADRQRAERQRAERTVARLTTACVLAERTAGSILTRVTHEETPAERARLMSLAFWYAGRAEAYADEAEFAGPSGNRGAGEVAGEIRRAGPRVRSR